MQRERACSGAHQRREYILIMHRNLSGSVRVGIFTFVRHRNGGARARAPLTLNCCNSCCCVQASVCVYTADAKAIVSIIRRFERAFAACWSCTGYFCCFHTHQTYNTRATMMLLMLDFTCSLVPYVSLLLAFSAHRWCVQMPSDLFSESAAETISIIEILLVLLLVLVVLVLLSSVKAVYDDDPECAPSRQRKGNGQTNFRKSQTIFDLMFFSLFCYIFSIYGRRIEYTIAYTYGVDV